MSKWQKHAEHCGKVAAERLHSKNPTATQKDRDEDMWKAGWVLLTYLREKGAENHEIECVMPEMLRAYNEAWSKGWWERERLELDEYLMAEQNNK